MFDSGLGCTMRGSRKTAKAAQLLVAEIVDGRPLDIAAIAEVLATSDSLERFGFRVDPQDNSRLAATMADFVCKQCLLAVGMPEEGMDAVTRKILSAQMRSVQTVRTLASLCRGLAAGIKALEKELTTFAPEQVTLAVEVMSLQSQLLDGQPVSTPIPAGTATGTTLSLPGTTLSPIIAAELAQAKSPPPAKRAAPAQTTRIASSAETIEGGTDRPAAEPLAPTSHFATSARAAPTGEGFPALATTQSEIEQASPDRPEAPAESPAIVQAPLIGEVALILGSTLPGSDRPVPVLLPVKPVLNVRTEALAPRAQPVVAPQMELPGGPDPTQAAGSGAWTPHEGATIIEDVSKLTRFSGRGLRSMLAPEGTGPVRFERGYRWERSATDGVWRDQTAQERRERAKAIESGFNTGFDDPFAPEVHNVVPTALRGYEGPGRHLSALMDLADAIRPTSPHSVPCFDPGGDVVMSFGKVDERSFNVVAKAALDKADFLDGVETFFPKKFLTTRPVLRLRAKLNADLEEDWPDAEPIVSADFDTMVTQTHYLVPRTLRSIDEEPSEAKPPYAKAARRIKDLNEVRVEMPCDLSGLDRFEAAVVMGSSYVYSGPAGSGKTYQLVKLAKLILSRVTGRIRCYCYNVPSDVLLEEAVKGKGMSQYKYLNKFERRDFAKMIDDVKYPDGTYVLFVDEYAEMTIEQLSQLSNFHQVIFFGDYAQAGHKHQPIFDFVRRCGGGSRELTTVWRAGSAPLFDAMSLLAYSGAYRAIPGPNNLPGFTNPPAIVTLSCPDDPQVEVLAMGMAARRHPDAKIIIVVDEEAAYNAVVALPESERIAFKRSDELRGHQCDVIIFAAGAFDRLALPTDELIERLIVIFGRAKQRVEIMLPESESVGSAKRRCSCLLAPLLSFAIAAPDSEPVKCGLAEALAKSGVSLVRLAGLLLALKQPMRCLLVTGNVTDEAVEPVLAIGWAPFHAVISSDLLNLPEAEVIADPRFATLVAHLDALSRDARSISH